MDYYPEEEESGGDVYGWLVYVSAAFFLIACIVKYVQISSYN